MAFHLDEFPAQAISAYHHGYENVPFIVVQQESVRYKSQVVACSAKALDREIVAGMALSELTSRQSDGLHILQRKPRYEDLIFDDLCVLANKYTPDYEVEESGECILNIQGTPLGRSLTLDEVAERFKEELAMRLGLINIGVGVARMKTLARVLARRYGQGVSICPTGKEMDWLQNVEIFDIPGVQSETAEKMAAKGFRRFENICMLGKREMMKRFGRELGEWFYMLSVGCDLPFRPKEKVSFREEKVLTVDINDETILREHVLETVDKVLHKIQCHGKMAKSMRLSIGYSDGRWVDGAIKIDPPTDVLEDVSNKVFECFCRLYQRRVALRVISISCQNVFQPENTTQLSFFSQGTVESANRKHAINEIRSRFGFNSLSKGTYHRVGKKNGQVCQK